LRLGVGGEWGEASRVALRRVGALAAAMEARRPSS
jgi:hypothetical protein